MKTTKITKQLGNYGPKDQACLMSVFAAIIVCSTALTFYACALLEQAEPRLTKYGLSYEIATKFAAGTMFERN